MSEKIESIAAALSGLEQALDAFAPPLSLADQPLEAVDLGPASPISPAPAFEGVDHALDPLVEALGAALGDL